MKRIIGLAIALTAMLVVAACVSVEPAQVNGIVLPYPEQGNQYRMSEVCAHIEAEGYNVKGTLHHTFGPDAFADALDDIPTLARRPLENYLENGLAVSIEVQSLCQALNRDG